MDQTNNISSKKMPKWLWWVISVVAVVVLAGGGYWLGLRMSGSSTESSDTTTSTTTTNSNLETFKDPFTGLVLEYEPEKVVIAADDYTGQAETTGEPKMNDDRVAIFLNLADANEDNLHKSELISWVKKVNNGEITPALTSSNGVKMYEDTWLGDALGSTYGYSIVRDNMLIEISTTLYGVEGWEPKNITAEEYSKRFNDVVMTARFANADEFTASEKDLNKVFHYCLSGSVQFKDEECIKMWKLYNSSNIDDKRSSQACDWVVDEDVTGDGAKDKVVMFSGCGSGSSYPSVYTANNGFIKRYNLEYPSDRYPKTKTDISYPDTGLAVVGVFNGKIVVAVPVHSESDDCHTCVTGGAEFIEYSWNGDGFDVSNYKYDSAYQWDFEELTNNPF